MQSITPKLFNLLRVSPITAPSSSLVLGLQESSRAFFSTGSESGNDSDDDKKVAGGDDVKLDIGDDKSSIPEKDQFQMQTVDPIKGWNFRGVHRAIICGTVEQTPVQKMLRNGKSVTIFRVGTGGMSDQRQPPSTTAPKPAQWHRIAVHNPMLGNFAVQQLVKDSKVYVEGDIETRIYDDLIRAEAKSIPEICVRSDGKLRLMKSGETADSISIDELRQGLQ